MNSTGIIIVAVLGLAGLYLIMRKQVAANTAQTMYAPNAAGGSTPEAPGALFSDIASGMSSLINSGISIADQVDRNG